MEGFEGAEVPPGGGQAVLQELPAALARRLEQLYVTSQPGHEGPDHDVGHLGQLVVQQGSGGVVCHLLEHLVVGLGPYIQLWGKG